MHLLYSRTGARSGELDDATLVELYRWPAPLGRSWLRTNFISTLDGSIQGPDGRSGTINTPSDHHVFALHRSLCDAVLVGAQTVRTEGYRAVDLAAWQRDLRRREGLADFPTLVIISGSLDLDPRLADPPGPHGPVLIITSSARSDTEVEPFVATGAEVVRPDGDEIVARQVIEQLVRRELPRVLCEGGPRLHRDLLAADLVDELSLTLAPTVVGGSGQRSTSGDLLPAPLGFELQHLIYAAEDQTVLTRYRRAPVSQ